MESTEEAAGSPHAGDRPEGLMINNQSV